MDSKKQAPATQQPHHVTRHVHPNITTSIHQQNYQNPLNYRHASSQPYQMQTNGIVHQLLMKNPSSYQTNLPMSPGSSDARSPLLDNAQDLYGTRQMEYARHYGVSENYPYPQRAEMPQSPINQDITHAVPKGYDPEVYQDYLKRNPPKDTNQIYQNHQSAYQPNSSQYNKSHIPYSNRILQPSESNTELLRRQYNEIQQMKLRQQMRYQSEAQMQQQQTFAERQLLLQQIHGVQPPPNLQQSIYSDSPYKDSDRYDIMSQQTDRDERFQPQSPSYQASSNVQAKPSASNQSPGSPVKSSGDSTSPSVKSPVSSDGRRSSGGGGAQALRSPIAQRPASAPVTMSGMLYKQGSDGLKVWRKRWFVLAEYCLFYYKSQDEEKLLGSVLLPSYKVSACAAEDRVLRKFAFKLEHANMRTYVLAAADQETALRWVRALTMAALMQDPKPPDDKTKKTAIAERTSQKDEDFDDNGPTYANAPPKPRRSNDGYGSPAIDIYDPNYDLLQKPASHYSQGTNHNRFAEPNQNLYQESTQNRHQDNSQRYSEAIQQRHQDKSLSIVPSNNYDPRAQSPQYDQYGQKKPFDQSLSMAQPSNHPERSEQHQVGSYKNDHQSAQFDNRARSYQQQQREQQKLNDEILTEQIYNRNQNQNLLYMKEKNHTDPRQMDSQNKNLKSYNQELLNNVKGGMDKYESKSNNDPNIYNVDHNIDRAKGSKAPSTEKLSIERRTPDAYGRSTVLPNYGRGKASDYEDVYPTYQPENEYGMSYSKPMSPPSLAEKKSIQSMQNYQHSNYPENYNKPAASQSSGGPSVLRRKKMQSNNPAPLVPRPHSADFLEYEARNELDKTIPSRNPAQPAKQPQRPKSSLDINSFYDPSSDRYYSEESYAEKMRQSAQYLQQKAMSNREFQAPLAKYSSGLAQKQLNSAYNHSLNNNYESGSGFNNSKFAELEALNSNWTLKEKSAAEQARDYRTGSAMSNGSTMSGFTYEGANAREMSENFMRSASARLPSTTEGKEGERKREESMKRLLEWKQRMLQSPLTRKSTPASISLARSLNQKQTGRINDPLKQKSMNYNNASYNSYSSDDEASVSMSGALGQNNVTQQTSLTKKPFVGSNTSIGRSGRDNNIPVRAVSPRVRWVEDKPNDTYGSSKQLSSSQQNLSMGAMADDWSNSMRSAMQQPIRAVSPRVRQYNDNDDIRSVGARPSGAPGAERASSVERLARGSLPAGDLLGRSHHELVLLLIQLRRRHAHLHHACRAHANKIHTIKEFLGTASTLERQESLARLEQLKQQLSDLENQYRKSQPLVHLVDNMVKLGSLYTRPTGSAAGTIERLERNQRLRQKVLAEQAEEQRRWVEGEIGDPEAARARVEELWALERELAAEAATLHGLRADKQAIESLLTGVRSKFGSMTLEPEVPPAASPASLEADLARVHAMLAHNSKKLQATVTDNARLQRELLALRRALHTHRHTAPHTHSATPALLEDEVSRVQQLVSDLQRQRQELSLAVRHLTQQSRDLQTAQTAQAALPAHHPPHQHMHQQGGMRRRTVWQETDLDSGACVEHGADGAGADAQGMQPLYVDTRSPAPPALTSPLSDDSHHFGNLSNVEKQEIKTVRIVKRESERRQRDRDRTLQPDAGWNAPVTAELDHLLEEELSSSYSNRSASSHSYSYDPKSKGQPPNYLQLSSVNIPSDNLQFSPKYPSSPSLAYDHSRDSTMSSYRYDYDRTLSLSTQFLNSPTDSNRTLTNQFLDSPTDSGRTLNNPVSKASSVGSLTRTAELSPIFKSEAARQIITEMSGDAPTVRGAASLHRRQVPREKRRHNTAPQHLSASTLSQLPGEYFGQEKVGRSLDDADMELVLRAPPDVVRSALAPQRFAESTIDQLLLAPRKILIPERYVPEKPPELSPEEQKKRLEKVESIKKMLSSTTSDPSKSPDEGEKKHREHLLQMNQILAKQVMEMSKLVAGTNGEQPSSTNHN